MYDSGSSAGGKSSGEGTTNGTSNGSNPANGSGKPERQVAAVPISLAIDAEDPAAVDQAAKAIRAELKLSRKWTQLKALDVAKVRDNGTEVVYKISVGKHSAIDWTLEGSIAARPTFWNRPDRNVANADAECDRYVSRQHQTAVEGDDRGDDDVADDEDLDSWMADVVSVDMDLGLLFVSMSPHDPLPARGVFWVEPFAFLRALDDVFSNEASLTTQPYLLSRIVASAGRHHPTVPQSLISDWQHQSELAELWRHAWSVLWGPPGTGKTQSIGTEIAKAVDDPESRVLVVSTTNNATDEVAIRIAELATRNESNDECLDSIVRIGKTADVRKFQSKGVQRVLSEESLPIREQIASLKASINQSQSASQRAFLNIKLRQAMADLDEDVSGMFFDPDIRVVVCTAFQAIYMLRNEKFLPKLDEGYAPFTTVVIDEAGLIPRAAVAALSLMAADRVCLVGDPRQLSPIAQVQRIIEPIKHRWLAKSGLSHLKTEDAEENGIHLLSVQHRMHSEIAEVVSHLQYNNQLRSAESTNQRKWNPPSVLSGLSRAMWYVLDEETNDRPKLRGDRGKSGKSYQRELAFQIFDKLFGVLDTEKDTGESVESGTTDSATNPEGETSLFREWKNSEANCLYVAPFRAQVKLANEYFQRHGLSQWQSSTVHSQQGGEADIVIFDTVHANPRHGWSEEEWLRLVNVAISRARHQLIISSSRDEMRSTHLRPLTKHLQPVVLQRHQGRHRFVNVNGLPSQSLEGNSANGASRVREPDRPLLSRKQEMLCQLQLDGKPRLVRGVAGSGKTKVMAEWLVQTVRELMETDPAEDKCIWVVYANASLGGLISEQVRQAWNSDDPFPWDKVKCRHLRDVLDERLKSVKIFLSEFGDDVNAASQAYLERVPDPEAVCWAMFVDESQDFGPNTLRLLTRLTERTSIEDANSRNVNFFYDNAQNLYNRPMPRWKDLGLDLRGRSSVMEESFRSTHLISEFALNVLYQLSNPDKDPDYRELVKRDLVEPITLNATGTFESMKWWRVKFNHIEGPLPDVRVLKNFALERAAIVQRICHWVNVDGVRPSQICLLYNGSKYKEAIEFDIAPALQQQGIDLHLKVRESLHREDESVLATTSHSFKGHDADYVYVMGVNGFALKTEILHHALYVALTRARVMLSVSGSDYDSLMDQRLIKVLSLAMKGLIEARQTRETITDDDIVAMLLGRLGSKYQDWIHQLVAKHGRNLQYSPVKLRDSNEPIDVLFHLDIELFRFVCVEPAKFTQEIRHRLAQSGFEVIEPGSPLVIE